MFDKSMPMSNYLLSDGMVEILADNGANYKAYVMDVDTNEWTDPNVAPNITLRFENDWHPIEKFPLNRIRLPPHQHIDNSLNATNDTNATDSDKTGTQDFKEGQDVEVLAIGNDGEGYGFWRCVIKMIKGDFYVVTYVLDNTIKVEPKNFSEIITKDKIRAINTNPYFKTNPFYKFCIEVPKDVIKTNDLIKKSENHLFFKKSLGLICVNYDDLNDRLICIGFAETNKNYYLMLTKKKAMILSDIHFRSLKEKFEFIAKNESLKQKLTRENTYGDIVLKSNAQEFELNVKIAEHLIRLAIGANGANLKRIEQIPGVISVHSAKGVFKVIGKTREACLRAKDLLYFMETVVQIPRSIVGHIIGKKGQHIQEVTDKSGLTSIIVKGDNNNEPLKPFVSFVLVGTPEAIENGKLLIDFHKNCIEENKKFESKKT